jgi:hypothetical protein
MDTHDLDEPFKSQPMAGAMDVHGRSMALLMEDGIEDPEREPHHAAINVIEVEMSRSDDAEAGPASQGDTQEAVSHPGE